MNVCVCVGGGGGESMRDLGQSIDYLLIFVSEHERSRTEY